MTTTTPRPRLPFRDLPIGTAFDFASVEDFPHSGMALGPWVKDTARTYHRESDPAFVCRVGSITVEVLPR